MGTPKDSEATRATIIEAAGQLFAQKGFSGVTVRDITKKANTHLSALNYHFRTKEALYREVLMEACQAASISPEERDYLAELDPKEALFVLVKAAIGHYAKQSASNWKLLIINRECWEPSPVFEEVVAAYFKPETEFITQIIGRIVNRPAESHEVRFAAIGLIGLLSLFGSYDHFTDAVAPGFSSVFHKKDWLVKQLVRITVEAAKVPG